MKQVDRLSASTGGSTSVDRTWKRVLDHTESLSGTSDELAAYDNPAPDESREVSECDIRASDSGSATVLASGVGSWAAEPAAAAEPAWAAESAWAADCSESGAVLAGRGRQDHWGALKAAACAAAGALDLASAWGWA